MKAPVKSEHEKYSRDQEKLGKVEGHSECTMEDRKASRS